MIFVDKLVLSYSILNIQSSQSWIKICMATLDVLEKNVGTNIHNKRYYPLEIAKSILYN